MALSNWLKLYGLSLKLAKDSIFFHWNLLAILVDDQHWLVWLVRRFKDKLEKDVVMFHALVFSSQTPEKNSVFVLFCCSLGVIQWGALLKIAKILMNFRFCSSAFNDHRRSVIWFCSSSFFFSISFFFFISCKVFCFTWMLMVWWDYVFLQCRLF